jgi:hypothetical protein
MDRPSTRRLKLSDLAILIASTSVGLWVVRTAHENRFVDRPDLPTHWSWKIGLEASPFLLTTSAGLLMARLLAPRPGPRVIFRQPGVMACLAILAGWALGVAFRVGHIQVARLHGFGLNYSLDSYLAIVMDTGGLVAASWVTLALAGAWRPESSWIDRSGRFLGVFTIILWVTSELSL